MAKLWYLDVVCKQSFKSVFLLGPKSCHCSCDAISKTMINVLHPIHDVVNLAFDINKFDVMTYKTLKTLSCYLITHRKEYFDRPTKHFYFSGENGLVSTTFL
jgi:hypothetical protein